MRDQEDLFNKLSGIIDQAKMSLTMVPLSVYLLQKTYPKGTHPEKYYKLQFLMEDFFKECEESRKRFEDLNRDAPPPEQL